MKQEEGQTPQVHDKHFNFQKTTDYYFKATYEYEGARKAEAITRTIHDNFILPCWVQRYITTENFTIQNQGKLEDKKQIVSNYLNMLDYRVLQLGPDGNIQFSIVDKHELGDMRLIRQLNQEYKGEIEAENYRQEAISLYTKWEQFLKHIQSDKEFKNTVFAAFKKNKILRVYIVQRIFKSEYKIKVQNNQKGEHSAKDKNEGVEFCVEEFFYFRDVDQIQQQQKSTLFIQEQDNYAYSEINYFIPWIQDTKQVGKPYTVNLRLTFEKNQVVKPDRKLLYYRIPENADVKILRIYIQIEDKQQLFIKRLKVGHKKQERSRFELLQCFNSSKFYGQIGTVQLRNKITFPYQQAKFQRNKISLNKHFHLAFQGGGAKGLAYVGAYKSIREQKYSNPYKNLGNNNKQGNKDERIPIKSIMGSSAGGIIALAISTGIPQYELQKICYKMNAIPSTDRFTPFDQKQVKATDDYGNEITMQTVKQSLVRIFDQYGIIQKGVIEKFLNFVSQSPQSKQIQDKLLRWLAINSNAMAQILTLQYQDQIQPGFIGSIFGKKPEKKNKFKINWEGLLLHGALMKGEAIHDIAKDCVVKFLFKERMYRTEKEFIKYLQDCQDPQKRDPSLSYCGISLNKFLNQQLTQARSLLQIKLKDIWNAFGGNKQKQVEAFGTFLVGLVNRFLILLDNYYKLTNENKGLILLQASKPKVLVSSLPFKTNFGSNGLIQYFKKCFTDEKGIQQQDIIMNKSQLQGHIKGFWQKGLLDTRQGQRRLDNSIVVSSLFRDIQGQQTQKLSYSQINSLLNRQNLINPADLDFKNFIDSRKQKQETIIQYLRTIFGSQLIDMKIEKLLQDSHQAIFVAVDEKQKDDQVNRFFYSLEAAESIYEVYNLLKPTLKQLNKVENNPFHEAVNNYEVNMKAFKKEVAKVTMREYFRLTGIELSCTSVDLDNKVLRFFNHKTTPLLPVCRSVQMTGSFPVGFKAQKWKKQWGLYYVYSLEQKHVIDITGHQFTDGGLLANFPIKYMDNDLIRKRYFSQKAIAGETILLGFGLDYLDSSRYQLTEKQLKSLKQQKNKSAIALQELKGIFGLWTKIVDGFSVFSNTRGGSQVQKWSQIEHWLIRQIPLLRFGLKIAEAYPNADRNLNLQSFDNKVLIQQMWPDWTAGDFHLQTVKAEEKAYIKQLVDYYHLHLKQKYDKFNEGNNRLQNALKVQKLNQTLDWYGKQVNYFINQKQTDIKDRFKIVQDQFNALFLKGQFERFKDLLTDPNVKSDEKVFLSSTLSLSLINIYFIHLRIKENSKVVDRYNKFYVFIKFIADDFTFQKEYIKRKKSITTAEDISITEDLNRINFSTLYDQQNFEEIAKHLGFEGYYSQYYTQFMEKYSKAINSQNEFKFKKDKKQATEARLKKEYPDDMFADMSLFDVTESIKRLTQLIYLMVKGRDQNGKLKGVAEIRRLTSHVKSINYKELFYNPKELQRKQSLTIQTGLQPLYYCQIIDFFKNQLETFRKGSLDFYLADSFYNFINEYDFNDYSNMKLRYLQGLIEHKNGLKINIKNYKPISGDEEKIDRGTQKWLQREYKFVAKYKSKDTLIERMKIVIKQDILRNKNKQPTTTAKILFEVLYDRKPTKKQDKGQLQQLDELLTFLLDDVNIQEVYGVSIERQEMIKRRKRQGINKVYSLLKGYRTAIPGQIRNLPQDIDFMQGVKIRRKFVKQIYETTQKFNPIVKNNGKKQQEKRKSEKNPGQVDSFSLRLVELEVIYLCVNGKIEAKIQEAQQIGGQNYCSEKLKYLLQLNTAYFYDMKYLFDTLKEMIFLTKSILVEGQYSPTDTAAKIVQKLKQQQIATKIIFIYKSILNKFIPKYYSLEQVSLSEITKSKISQPFIIEFEKINTFAQTIYKTITDLYYQKCKKNIEGAEINLKVLNVTKQENVIRYMYNSLAKLVRHKFSLPLLDIQWELSSQSTGKIYQQKVYNILANQFYKKSNGFNVPVIKYRQNLKEICQHCPHKDVDSSVHLILEGVQSSNNYFGGLYQNIGKIMAIKNQEVLQLGEEKKQACLMSSRKLKQKPKTLDEEHIRNIKAITCANFHSVFGFLLAMGFSLEEIRKEMFKLKYITNVMQNQVVTDKYFDSYAWANNCSHRHKYLIQELENHNTKFFDRVDTLRKKDFKNTKLTKEYEEIKLLYNHEKQIILQTEARILDQTADSIKYIAGRFQPTKFPLQISKTFGYNYLCELQHNHRYKDLSQESFKSFKKIAQTIFETFGSLIQGIVTNSLTSHTAINITQQNAKYVTKGLLINRLLSTFKLNDYITKKLKESRLSPNISLSEFYQVSKRKIFLNFTVIDVNRQRLAFLNKNTMPNMPLWAAIIATSSLPFFHQFFEANKQWQATDASSFYDFFVYQFFKADQDKNMRITQYTSGNFISSVPLELLTNNTLSRKIFDPKKDAQIMDIPQFAVCFNPSSECSRLCDVPVKKNYINISTFDVFKGLLSGVWSGVKSIPGKIASMLVRKNPHQNETYNIEYPPGEYLSKWLSSTTFMTTFSILSNSNDNFILKWYYDKLIRLPIKIDTLDFHEIVEGELLKTYLVNVLSQKAQQTVERSYEITSSFIYNIVQRTVPPTLWKEQAIQSLPKIELEPSILTNFTSSRSEISVMKPQRSYNESQIVSRIFDLYKQKQKDRFRVKFRVQLQEKAHPKTGFKRLYFKLSFLNHSKWNHNNYNNFVVQYAVDEGEDLYGNRKVYKRADESQISWLVESNNIISLRFYYLLKECHNVDTSSSQSILKILSSKDQDMQIRETELQLDFKDIIKKLPLRDSYDYQFHYGWEQNFEPAWDSKITPIKRNKLAFTQESCGENPPAIILKIIGEEDNQQFKTKHIIKKTTRHKKKEDIKESSAKNIQEDLLLRMKNAI